MNNYTNKRPRTFDVYVGNIPAGLQEDSLRPLFNRFGNIASISVFENPGRSSYGYVRYTTEEEANAALLESNFHLGDVKLFVKRGERKEARSQKQFTPPQYGGYGQREQVAQQPIVLHEEDVLVSYIESPKVFYGHATSQLGDLEAMTSNLESVQSSANVVSGIPQRNKVYATIFSADDAMYRCKVIEVEDEECTVQFIDYGNTEVKSHGDVLDIPPRFCATPPLAHCFTLYGIDIVHDDTSTLGYEQTLQFMRDHCEEQTVTMKLIKQEQVNEKAVIVIAAGGVNVNDKLVEEGLATKRSTSCVSSPQPNKLMSESPQYPQSPIPMNVQNYSSGQSPGGPPFVSPSYVNPAPDLNKLTNDPHSELVQQLKQRLMNVEKEKSMFQEQITEMRYDYQVKMNAAKLEIERATSETNNYKLLCKTLQEDANSKNIGSKIKTLIQTTNSVRMLRSQFPMMCDNRQDYIEQAIDTMVHSKERIDVTELTVLMRVKDAHEAYDESQRAIKLCVDKAMLDELILTRNAARVSLHGALTQFISDIGQMPLEQRKLQLLKVSQHLKETHSALLSMKMENNTGVTLEDAMNKYHDWKEKKRSDFEEARTETNTKHNSVNSALQLLQQQLSPDTLKDNAPVSSTAQQVSLDVLMDNLLEATKREIESTDLMRSLQAGTCERSELVCITLMLHSLVQSLHSEMTDITQLNGLQKKYAAMVIQLQPWLYESPGVKDLTNCKKEIKSLKSQLRHKLADKQDAIENEDSSDSELQEIEEDLSSIRTKLQSSFCQEAMVVKSLASVYENHFPELHLQHPDAGLKAELEENGLLKSGRTLDQYTITSTTDMHKVVCHHSKFAGEDILLKEYLVDDSIGINRADFTQRCVAYSRIHHPHIVPMKSIFFVQKQAYVQVPAFKHTLLTAVAEFTSADCHQCLLDVLGGISAMHQQQCVYGTLTPEYIHIDDERRAYIEETDCTKTLMYRVENCIANAGRVLFSPLVIGGQKEAPGPALDMYYFGLVAFWMHFHDQKFVLDSYGIPDITSLPINPDLEIVLRSLLVVNPQSRATFKELANMDYFRLPRVQPPQEDVTLQLRRSSLSPELPRPANPSGGILKNSPSSSSLSNKDVDCPVVPALDISEHQSTPSVTVDHDADVGNQAEEASTPNLPTERQMFPSTGDTPVIMNQNLLDTSVVTPVLHATPMDTPRNTPNETFTLEASNDANQVTVDEISKLAQQLCKMQTDGKEGEGVEIRENVPCGASGEDNIESASCEVTAEENATSEVSEENTISATTEENATSEVTTEENVSSDNNDDKPSESDDNTPCETTEENPQNESNSENIPCKVNVENTPSEATSISEE